MELMNNRIGMEWKEISSTCDFFLSSERSGRPSSKSRPWRDGRPSFIFVSLILLALAVPLGTAAAAEFRLVPSLALKEEYNDNIFYSEADRVDDFITTITPGLELVSRTEKLDLNLLALLNVLRYLDTTELNNIDQNYSGRFRYSLNPKWTVSGGAGYLEDSRPDRDLEITGLVIGPVIRKRQNYMGGVEHIFSEKTKASLSYTYEREDYDNPEFADLKAHNAGLGFIHDLSKYLPNVAARMNLGYSRYEYDIGTIDYYYATIGVNWALDEKWSLLFDGGGSYTFSESGPTGNEQKDEGAGWVGMGSLAYKGEKTTGDLTFSHRKAPAYGSVGVTERTSLSFGINRRFTYEFSGGLSAGYFINKADEGKFSRTAFDQESFYVSPRLRYEFTRDVFLEGSYNFSYTRDKESNTDVRRSLVMLRLYMQYPLFE
jgi:hypothetical protein